MLRIIAVIVGLATLNAAALAKNTVPARNVALVRKVLNQATTPLHPSLIETVSCPSDGQTGPLAPPRLPKTLPMLVPAEQADELAFYAAFKDFADSGVVAPKHWNCFGSYGSGGYTLYVAPSKNPGQTSDALITGPAVIKSRSLGSTSGRFDVARAAARLFPVAARKFIKGVVAEGVDTDIVPARPLPSGAVTSLEATVVRATIPAQTDFGLTGRFKPAADPISAIVALVEDSDDPRSPDLEEVMVRLPRASQSLLSAIAAASVATLPERWRE